MPKARLATSSVGLYVGYATLAGAPTAPSLYATRCLKAATSSYAEVFAKIARLFDEEVDLTWPIRRINIHLG